MSMSNKVDSNNNSSEPFEHLGPLTPDISYSFNSPTLFNDVTSFNNSSYQQHIFNGGTSSIKYTSAELLNIPRLDFELSALLDQTLKVEIFTIFCFY